MKKSDIKIFALGLLLLFIFIGCGYKGDPIYIENDKKVESNK